MKGPQCNCCRFWKMDEATADPSDPDWGFGYCRRRPPVLVDSLVSARIVPPRYGQQSDLDRPDPVAAWNASVWPATFATDWCGEFADPVEGD